MTPSTFQDETLTPFKLGEQLSRISFGLNRGARDPVEEVQSPGTFDAIGAERRLMLFWRKFFLPACQVVWWRIGGLNPA